MPVFGIHPTDVALQAQIDELKKGGSVIPSVPEDIGNDTYMLCADKNGMFWKKLPNMITFPDNS